MFIVTLRDGKESQKCSVIKARVAIPSFPMSEVLALLWFEPTISRSEDELW